MSVYTETSFGKVKSVVLPDTGRTRRTHDLLIAREVIGSVQRVAGGERRYRVCLHDKQGRRRTIYQADEIPDIEKAVEKMGYRIRPIKARE